MKTHPLKKSGPGVSTGAYKTDGSRQDLMPNLSTHRQPTFSAVGMGAVRTFIVRLIGRFSSPVCMSANEAAAAEVLAVNERAYDMESEGVMVVPFGEVPVMVSINGRAIRGLQRIDAEAGNAMAADMSGMLGKLKSLFNGYPIYMGHPFHPIAAEAAKYPDKKARGFIKSVEVANNTIRLIPKYNTLGQGEVGDQQLIYHSPQWRMVPVMAANGAQEVKNGMPVFRPVALHSGGLTNDPNIPVPPLMAGNEAAAESTLVASIKAALG